MSIRNSVNTLKGVGAKREELLKKLNIKTIDDLLHFFPRKYEDRRTITTIIEAPLNSDVLLSCKVVMKKTGGSPYSRKQLLRVLVEDNTGNLELLFFNAKYLTSYFQPGMDLILFGRITIGKTGRKQMLHPEFHQPGDKDDIRGLFPVYPLTEGLSQNQMRALQIQARPYISEIKEWLDESIVKENNLCSPSYAIENLHFPMEERPVLEGRYRLIFEELLILQTGLFYIKSGIKSQNHGIRFKDIPITPFLDVLPFELTGGQRKAVNEIKADLISEKPMNRLVQGDVGSGKTAVAEISMYQAVKSGYQAVMMAPTELLAKQHMNNLSGDFVKLGIRVELLSSSTTKKEREKILSELKSGEIDILVGTHAIIQPDVQFKALGLVITDEQHRFGVNQRNILAEKGKNPNILVMTATPIPRTLAVILYGDLDISVIDSLPAGRKQIKTYLRHEDSRNKIYDFVQNQVLAGSQAYVVCPLIEESETMNLKSAEEIYEELSKKYVKLNVGLVHGGMKQDEKDGIMLSFKNGDIDVLVSTVVIEVGIDVPNANVMVIENSERFGLAQLHQLRGRVGRGQSQSYCILISGSDSEISNKRNEIMCQTTDGFVIAEEDLKLRGPGEIFGTRQHGLPELQIADLVKNIDILERVRNVAKDIIEKDPELISEENLELRYRVKKLFGENISLKL